jgi:AcrR family transcriptional regulator
MSTKDRILDTTTDLFRRYGYNGTGLKQIVANANAPFGSIYHFFPGGKEQLGDETIRRAGEMYGELVAAVFDAAPDAVTGTSDVFTGAAEVLRETDYLDPCPVATVALEVASANDRLRQATADVFESWIDGATERYAAAGIAEARAREIGIALIGALEGAFVLSRALRSTEPLEIADRAVTALVRAELSTSRRA